MANWLAWKIDQTQGSNTPDLTRFYVFLTVGLHSPAICSFTRCHDSTFGTACSAAVHHVHPAWPSRSGLQSLAQKRNTALDHMTVDLKIRVMKTDVNFKNHSDHFRSVFERSVKWFAKLETLAQSSLWFVAWEQGATIDQKRFLNMVARSCAFWYMQKYDYSIISSDISYPFSASMASGPQPKSSCIDLSSRSSWFWTADFRIVASQSHGMLRHRLIDSPSPNLPRIARSLMTSGSVSSFAKNSSKPRGGKILQNHGHCECSK